MKHKQSLRGLLVIALNGAMLRTVNDDGEVTAELDLEPGYQDLTKLHPLTRLGTVETLNVLIVSENKGRLRTMKMDNRNDTSASPTYQMPMAQQQERQMKQMMERVVLKQAKEDRAKEKRRQERLEKRERREERKRRKELKNDDQKVIENSEDAGDDVVENTLKKPAEKEGES